VVGFGAPTLLLVAPRATDNFTNCEAAY